MSVELPIEPSLVDARYDRVMRWAKTLTTFALGLVSGVVTMLVAGDARYVRHGEFESHVKMQARLEQGIEVEAATVSALAVMDREHTRRIRQLERNQSWIATALHRIAEKQGVRLPPPPALSQGEDQ